MNTYKLTFLVSILLLIFLLSACGTGGINTPSGALATSSAESRLEVSEATSVPTESPVPTDTPVPPPPVATEPPVPTDTPVPPTPVVALPPPTLLYFWAQW